MQGAREFASMFKTGQHGRLYLVSGSHARGNTFHIYVLPEGVEVKPNGSSNPPLNSDAVEVYGITYGQPGWTESYGWLYKGKWCDDFAALVEAHRAGIAKAEAASEQAKLSAKQIEANRIAALLAAY